MKYLLDTNICIYLLKDSSPALTKRIFSQNPEDMAVSAITMYELEYGAAKSRWSERTRQRLAMFLAPFHVLPFTSEDAAFAGQIRGFLEKKGTPIGPYDLLIAAQGYARGLTVLTHNVKEFSRVPELKVEDWTLSQEE